MSQPPPASAIAALFDLGQPTEPLTPVAGGFSHHMWRLVTTRGAFAVKQLNRDWGDSSDANQAWLAWYERAFRIEQRAFDAGVPMPRPIPVAATGACLGEIDVGGAHPITVRAHEWIDGAVVPNEGYPADVPRRVGGIIAAIHALAIPDDDDPPHDPLWGTFGDEQWRALSDRVAAAGLPWADEMQRALPTIHEMEAYVLASQSDPEPRIMCQRDTDQKNVLATHDGRLLVIDWDGAGPVSARRDLAYQAFAWGGGYFGEPDRALLRAFVDGYRAAGGQYDEPRPSDLAESTMSLVAWFEFNVRRMLGERLQSDDDRLIAEREGTHVLRHLPRLARSIDEWPKMVG